MFYSETEDPSVPTEDIGVPNTEQGEPKGGELCARMKVQDAHQAFSFQSKIKWAQAHSVNLKDTIYPFTPKSDHQKYYIA